MIKKTVITYGVILLTALGYMIFHIGDPDGLQRCLFPHVEADLPCLIGLGILVFISSVAVVVWQNQSRVKNQINCNSDYVHLLLKDGWKEGDIADSFLSAVYGARRGNRKGVSRPFLFFYNAEKRKIIRLIRGMK